MDLKRHLHRLRSSCQLTDADILGDIIQECDIGQDFVTGKNNYVWLYLIAQAYRPRVIVELGTRFGYSLLAFVRGAGHPPAEFSLHSYDCEYDGIPCTEICRHYFSNVLGVGSLMTNKVDTRHLRQLFVPGGAELAFVDAYHTEAGCLHECRLAWDALRPGGVLVVDDISNEDVKRGADSFLAALGRQPEYIPSLRGIYLIEKPCDTVS